MQSANMQTDVTTTDVRGIRTSEEPKHDILEALRGHGSVSMSELTDRLGYSRNTSGVYAAVRDMVGSGTLECSRPDRTRGRNQRIRIRI